VKKDNLNTSLTPRRKLKYFRLMRIRYLHK